MNDADKFIFVVQYGEIFLTKSSIIALDINLSND